MRQPDQDKLNAFLGRMVGDLGAVATGALVLLGDRLGLYKAMQEGESITAAELAQKTGTHERYIREWLAAQAAAEHKRSGHRAKNIESSARAYGLARRGGLRTPAVGAAARPLPITHREREVAMHVRAGLSNRQIADRLVVSVRTAEGHLYRIFAKLAINSRDQLTQLLDLDLDLSGT